MCEQSIPITTEWQSVPCKLHTGCVNEKGYGRISRGGKARYRHRLAWEDAYGPIPDGLWVLHHCDNPTCYEVRHLFLGTPADNTHDMMRKGRYVAANSLKTHCKRGHEYTSDNTYWRIGKDGRRRRNCRQCNREANRRHASRPKT